MKGLYLSRVLCFLFYLLISVSTEARIISESGLTLSSQVDCYLFNIFLTVTQGSWINGSLFPTWTRSVQRPRGRPVTSFLAPSPSLMSFSTPETCLLCWVFFILLCSLSLECRCPCGSFLLSEVSLICSGSGVIFLIRS